MKYEDIFTAENVLFLANLTDRAQKYCVEKKVEISVENIEKARQWLFKKQQELANA